MLKVIVPLAAVLVAGGILATIQAQTQDKPAPQTPPAAAANPAAEAPRISVADAKKALDAGKAVLVDVRSGLSYGQEHAKGAISLPTQELAARMSELPKDKQIITYCT